MKPTNRWDAAGVADLRRMIDVSQEQFALMIGASVDAVSRWERGVYPVSRHFQVALTHLAKRCKAGMPLADGAPPPAEVGAALLARAEQVRAEAEAMADRCLPSGDPDPVADRARLRLTRHAKALEAAADYELAAAPGGGGVAPPA